MFIRTEPTPNPASIKFLPGRTVMQRGTAYFPTHEKARISPLAEQLFELCGVSSVFFGSDFITITKSTDVDWPALKPSVLGILAQYLSSGEPIIQDQQLDTLILEQEERVQDIVTRVQELLNSHVRPAVARDGGDIIFRDFRDGVVYVHLQGACSGCPSSTATLKNGIENLLKHYIPEVLSVQAVN